MTGDRDPFSSAADQDEECVNEFWTMTKTVLIEQKMKVQKMELRRAIIVND